MRTPSQSESKESGVASDWDNPREGAGGLSGGGARAQQGIASMGVGEDLKNSKYVKGVPPKMQDSVSALLGQLEKQNAQPRKDEVLPAIIAAAVLLASALYPLLKPVVNLFTGEDQDDSPGASEDNQSLQDQRAELPVEVCVHAANVRVYVYVQTHIYIRFL